VVPAVGAAVLVLAVSADCLLMHQGMLALQVSRRAISPGLPFEYNFALRKVPRLPAFRQPQEVTPFPLSEATLVFSPLASVAK
jgi:hypothetical protein